MIGSPLPETTALDIQPTSIIRARRALKQGCRANLWLILVVALMTPALLCGLTLLFYLVFPPPRLDILILGVDGRGAEGFVSRTDSILLFGVNPSQLRASMVSIPRDLFIEVPGYGLQRINTVNALGEQEAEGGGVDLLTTSLETNFGVRVDRYVRLNFTAFIELVDSVGGITIEVERALVDDAYPTDDGDLITIRFDSGLQEMDGERALQYARTRHADDDYQRARRQQQILSALLAKLANPARWPGVMAVLNRNLDMNLTLWDMLTLAPPVILNLGRFEQLVIDRDYIVGTAEGNATPNYDLIVPWLEERFD